MKFTIGKKITLGFASAIVITAGLGGFTYWKLNALSSSIEVATTDALPGIIQIQNMQSLQRLNMSNVALYYTASDAEIDGIEKDMAKVSKDISEILTTYEATITLPQEKAIYDNISKAREKYSQLRKQSMALSREGKKAEALAMFKEQVRPAMNAMSDEIAKLVDYNQKNADEATTEMTYLANSGRTGVLVGVAAALLSGIGISYLTIRSINKALTLITKTLTSGAVQVNSASSQVAAASQSLAQGASEQAASLEETSSSLEEISSMTKKNADTAQQASILSTDAKAVSDKGNAAMAKMSTAIADIQKSASETAKIIKTIDEIAFQTNLLALNAAVEAARAGEAGKGFAVVAEEVRNLAMRSAEAAKNTAALIDGSVQNAKNGVAIADEVATNLAEITDASAKVNLLVAEIAAACNEQSAGIGQVNQSIQQMDKVTQSNAAAAEESAASAQELSTQSEQLTSVVADLTRLVLGDNATVATGTRSTPAPTRKPAKESKFTAAAHPPAKQAAAPKLDRSQIPLDDTDAKSDDFSDFNLAA
ncbi:MAG: methyl-accepting chemotaxis protein [Tepidisphaeraceae bacterium]